MAVEIVRYGLKDLAENFGIVVRQKGELMEVLTSYPTIERSADGSASHGARYQIICMRADAKDADGSPTIDFVELSDLPDGELKKLLLDIKSLMSENGSS